MAVRLIDRIAHPEVRPARHDYRPREVPRLLQRFEKSGMPWAEKDMRILLHEADIARLALPVCGAVKEGIKALKIRMGLPMPDEKQ